MVSSALADRSYHPHGGGYSLEPAAAGLYAAFDHVPADPRSPRCPHCVSGADVAALAGPVVGLSPELVSRFVRKFGTTWGTTEDLRRVTPRILTLAADHRLDVSRALVWHQLRAAGWTTWPPDEADAVNQFVLAEFTRMLRVAPRPAHVAHRWLAQVSAGIDDISGFLTVWHDSIGPLPDPAVSRTAVGHLVELLTSSPLRPDLPATIADVLPLNAGAAHQLSAFLTGPGIDLDLRRAASDLADTPSSRRVNVAVERLRRFRSASEQRAVPQAF
ncbi:hypothetical protein [Aquihabitans sp. McL0605]|uniref:hypothetical protein n=1 Tax=Aquihabitans sp. McL0605 TaxID=3415671 RepID=UPI003CE99EF3